MTIKAVLRNGVIQPVEPIPMQWNEGQELLVEEPVANAEQAELAAWAREMDAATAQVPEEEHERFRKALDELEHQSKEAVKKEWGLAQ